MSLRWQMVPEPGVLLPGPGPGLLHSLCPRRAVPHHTHARAHSPGSTCTHGNTRTVLTQVHTHTHPHAHTLTPSSHTHCHAYTHHTHSCTLTPMHTCSYYVHSCAHTDTYTTFLPTVATCILGFPEQQLLLYASHNIGTL